MHGAIETLTRRDHLATPQWLNGLVQGQAMYAAPKGTWCLLEVGFEAFEVFLDCHIPGAVYLDTARLEREPYWNILPDAELEAVLLNLGICHDTTVVLYGRNTTAAGRVAHAMLYAGVADVRLLDGGFAAWEAAGLPTEAGDNPPRVPAVHFGTPFPLNPHFMVNTAQAAQLVKRPDGVLASIRTWDEFTGKTSGYCYIKAKGEIPGARWGHAGHSDDMNSMSDFQNHDGTMKPPESIRELWGKAGIRPDLNVAFYCGTGWRASLAFYYAWLMGWDRIAVYDGGWFEWSSGEPSTNETLPSTVK